jgi:hypothetical protein
MTIGYMMGIVLMHRAVNELVDQVKNILGLPSYLWMSRIAGILAIIGVLLWLFRKIERNPAKLKMVFVFIPLAIVADLSLVVVPIERIHYLQYALLTWLCYLATQKALPSALMAFFVGVLDEAYQYWVHYADNLNVYFDWNDIALNLIGVVAVLFLFLPESKPREKWLAKPAVVAIIGWVMMVHLVVSLFNPDQYLVRKDPYKGSSSFWITSNINTRYHVMNSLEGLLALGTVLILTMGYYLPNRTPPAQK